jgi:hypothetical protein
MSTEKDVKLEELRKEAILLENALKNGRNIKLMYKHVHR